MHPSGAGSGRGNPPRYVCVPTVESVAVPRPAPSPEWQPQGMLPGQGLRLLTGSPHLVEFGFMRRGSESHQAGGWRCKARCHRLTGLNRFRRILVRWDKSPQNYIAFLHFATACRLTGESAQECILHGEACRPDRDRVGTGGYYPIGSMVQEPYGGIIGDAPSRGDPVP